MFTYFVEFTIPKPDMRSITVILGAKIIPLLKQMIRQMIFLVPCVFPVDPH